MAVLGLGMDVCSIERIRKILAGPNGQRFVERVYTPPEQALCSSRADSAPSYAARFAAKEALVKALGAPPGIRWRDMEVTRGEGAPSFKLSGVAGAEVARRGARVLLALTHDAGVAAATVIIQGEER
ncbi:MAG: holo-ACP synthase [Myxococcaceae bacterium]